MASPQCGSSLRASGLSTWPGSAPRSRRPANLVPNSAVTDQFATEVDLPAPPEEVFRHLTDPAAMIRWMGQHAVLKPVPGGAFEIDINGVPVRGQYLEVDPPRRVLVSWGVAGNDGMPPGATEVEFTLTPIPAGTRLRLVHRRLPPGQEQV